MWCVQLIGPMMERRLWLQTPRPSSTITIVLLTSFKAIKVSLTNRTPKVAKTVSSYKVGFNRLNFLQTANTLSTEPITNQEYLSIWKQMIKRSASWRSSLEELPQLCISIGRDSRIGYQSILKLTNSYSMILEASPLVRALSKMSSGLPGLRNLGSQFKEYIKM